MDFRNDTESRSMEIATLTVFATGVLAFVLLHSVTLATSHGGEMLARMRLSWAVFVLVVLAAAVFVAQET